MKLLYGIVATLLALVLGALAFAYSGIYDVSASSAHSAPVRWLLHTTYHASMARRAEAVTVPDLSAERLRLAGAGDYDAMCAICHGAPGREPGALGQGLNPAPPDLAESARHLTDAELFWVTKHGIRMTGMPAWGTTHDDEALWPVVAFIRELPRLDPDAYRDMVDRATGLSHHAPGSATGRRHGAGGEDHQDGGSTHDHGADDMPEPDDGASAADPPPGREGHDHEH